MQLFIYYYLLSHCYLHGEIPSGFWMLDVGGDQHPKT